eukprot:7387590-Prymnesium_polylepis.1
MHTPRTSRQLQRPRQRLGCSRRAGRGALHCADSADSARLLDEGAADLALGAVPRAAVLGAVPAARAFARVRLARRRAAELARRARHVRVVATRARRRRRWRRRRRRRRRRRALGRRERVHARAVDADQVRLERLVGQRGGG